ncbi:unnamed protein product [Paramecium primaurelia]|uniref:Uncharacterized protein n=1 Tax=Paramecium primaurelia TaxID=5886 RepID=A0A8S1NPD7_PARPR|nr:unnamed protein product [Paramecium primaurelia]
MEDILEVENNNKITQEVYLKAIKELKGMYLNKLKKIKKAQQIRQISQRELSEYTKKIFNQYELLLEQQKKCQQRELSDVNDQEILSVVKTKKDNYLIITEKGIHYQCKCHKMKFKTYQELGGHQRTLK